MKRVFKCYICGKTVETTDMRKQPHFHFDGDKECPGNYVLIEGPVILPKRKWKK